MQNCVLFTREGQCPCHMSPSPRLEPVRSLFWSPYHMSTMHAASSEKNGSMIKVKNQNRNISIDFSEQIFYHSLIISICIIASKKSYKVKVSLFNCNILFVAHSALPSSVYPCHPPPAIVRLGMRCSRSAAA